MTGPVEELGDVRLRRCTSVQIRTVIDECVLPAGHDGDCHYEPHTPRANHDTNQR